MNTRYSTNEYMTSFFKLIIDYGRRYEFGQFLEKLCNRESLPI